MLSSRYKPVRTLVRQLCRLPGEAKADFRSKIARLRQHFERFNVDVADLCQWLMSLRPKDGNGGVPAFWNFFLEPALNGVEADDTERDRWRLAFFDDVAGVRSMTELAGRPLPAELRQAMDIVRHQRKTPTAMRLFGRLRGLQSAHQLVLLKAAAEWIVSRYQRSMENWVRQNEEWEHEKREWEKKHPQLTEEVRGAFTAIFKELVESPDGDEGKKGLRRKNPRLCPYKRLSRNKNNCIYAGQKGHGPLCWKYVEFTKGLKQNGKHFWENAHTYLTIRKSIEKPDVKRKLKTSARQEAFARLYKQRGMEQAKHWFTEAWKKYLEAMGLMEETVLQHGRLPHCEKIGETFEKSQCEWNPHTHLCVQYSKALAGLHLEVLALEGDYRDWRRSYLAPASPRSAIRRAGSCRCRKSLAPAFMKSTLSARSCACAWMTCVLASGSSSASGLGPGITGRARLRCKSQAFTSTSSAAEPAPDFASRCRNGRRVSAVRRMKSTICVADNFRAKPRTSSFWKQRGSVYLNLFPAMRNTICASWRSILARPARGRQAMKGTLFKRTFLCGS
jgi:hypothetical protein